jgi:hypothetical protein
MTERKTSRQHALACAFMDLAKVPDTPHPVEDVLENLAAHCVQLFDLKVSVLLAYDEGVRISTASSDRVRQAEYTQQQRRRGPSLDCLRAATRIDIPDLEQHEHHWPDYLNEVTHQGFRAVHILPLRWHDALGTLNLFLQLGTEDLKHAQALATAAAASVLRHRTQRQANMRVQQLQQALSSRVVIEQAKGVLVGRDSTTLEEAFRRLRGHARNHRQSLKQLATEVVEQANHTTAAVNGP